jgi:hypothetical protein
MNSTMQFLVVKHFSLSIFITFVPKYTAGDPVFLDTLSLRSPLNVTVLDSQPHSTTAVLLF